MNDHDIIDLTPVSIEELSPEEFLLLIKKEKSRIARSRPVPPKFGSSSFGKIEVEYKYPTFKSAF